MVNQIDFSFCENPLPPINEAVEAARKELRRSNRYTEPYSMSLKKEISNHIDVPMKYIHVNAGSELIIRQLFSMFGKRVHLLAPTWELFEKIAKKKTFTYLKEDKQFLTDLSDVRIPKATTLMPIVNPNNPTGGIFNIKNSLGLIKDYPKTMFLIDEAFIEFGGKPAVDLPERYDNVIVTRTFSKGFGLAGFRVGYAVLPKRWVNHMNEHNDPVPLARASEAAAIAALRNVDKIMQRVDRLKKWARGFAAGLEKIGVKTYPSETCFFLAKLPINAKSFAKELEKKNIKIKVAEQQGVGRNFVKFMTSTPRNNKLVVQALKKIMEGYK